MLVRSLSDERLRSSSWQLWQQSLSHIRKLRMAMDWSLTTQKERAAVFLSFTTHSLMAFHAPSINSSA